MRAYRRLLALTAVLFSSVSFNVLPAMAQATPALATADAQTTSMVEAAKAFIATLNDEQKSAVQFAFTDDTQRKNWSNFPLGGPGANRKGVKWGDLNDTQRAALITLLGTVLSPKGVTMVQEQMAADDIVAANDTGAPPGAANAGTPPAGATEATPAGTTDAAAPAAGADAGGPPAGQRMVVSFGSAYYFVSFVGEPSATTPWMLQFGGHHLAINATVVGADVTLSPSLTGGEPLKFTYDGKPVYIVSDEANQASALLKSLDPDQTAKAVVSSALGDLVLGPGKDGMVLQPEGLAGSAMTDAQKTELVKLVEARLNMLNDDDLAPQMDAIQKNIDQTYFAWFGPTDTVGGGYFRVTGPTITMEFSPQTNDGDPTDHAHNMYRDPTNEYGAAWTTLN